MDNTDNNGVVNNEEFTENAEVVEDTAVENTDAVEATAAEETEAVEEATVETTEEVQADNVEDAVEVEEVVVEDVRIDTPNNEQPPKHNLAIASLVLGIVSIVFTFCCCQFLGIALGVAGIVCSMMAKKEGNTETFVTAGLILSIIGAALGLIMTIIAIINIIAGAATGSHYSYGNSFTNIFYRFFRSLGIK